MNKTLVVSYLPREGSNTNKLVEAFLEETGDTSEIIHRPLDTQAVPLITKEVMETWWTPGAKNEAENASTQFINEIKSADKIVIATPMYNWSLPAPVKAWLDLVVRSGSTFEVGENGINGLLEDKKAALLVTSGMTKLEDETDHLTPNVKIALNFMGVTDITVIGADELMLCTKEEAVKRVESATKLARDLAKAWN